MHLLLLLQPDQQALASAMPVCCDALSPPHNKITRVWPCQWLSRNSANERAIQTELQGVAKNKATLVIAHRLSKVVDARSPSGFQWALSANVGAAEVGGVGFWVCG